MTLPLTGAGPPPFSPDSISGMQQWLSVRQRVQIGDVWQDTGATTPAGANDPVRRIGQFLAPSDAARPTLKTDGSGHYWLEFDGTDDVMDATDSWSGDYSVAWSGRLLAVGSFPLLVELNDSTGEELRGFSNTGRPDHVTAATGVDLLLTTAVTNTDVVLTATSKQSDGAHNIYSSGGETNSDTQAAGTARSVSVVRLGARSAGSLHANIRVYGMAVVDRILSATDRARLQAYLVALYS